MRKGWRYAVAALLLFVLAAGVVLSTTRAGAALLMWGLENQAGAPPPEKLAARVDAIVVLGGRTARIHQAARLHLATGIPLLLTGKGTGDSGFEAESEKMEDILLRDYGIGPRWVETESINTQENAVFSWCLVSGMGVRRIALLTDPFHMPRARAEFEAVGFRVVPLPAQDPVAIPWRPAFTWTWASFKPGRDGWQAARRPLLEWGVAVVAVLRGALLPAPQCDAPRSQGL